MSNIVDFNKEKTKIEDKKNAEAKRKANNEKVIRKIKRRGNQSRTNPWAFYGILCLVIAVVLLVIK